MKKDMNVNLDNIHPAMQDIVKSILGIPHKEGKK